MQAHVSVSCKSPCMCLRKYFVFWSIYIMRLVASAENRMQIERFKTHSTSYLICKQKNFEEHLINNCCNLNSVLFFLPICVSNVFVRIFFSPSLNTVNCKSSTFFGNNRNKIMFHGYCCYTFYFDVIAQRAYTGFRSNKINELKKGKWNNISDQWLCTIALKLKVLCAQPYTVHTRHRAHETHLGMLELRSSIHFICTYLILLVVAKHH